jgi:TonB family protein
MILRSRRTPAFSTAPLTSPNYSSQQSQADVLSNPVLIGSLCCAGFISLQIGILAQALAGAQETSVASPITFDTGTIADHIYSNECLGVSFPIPDGWNLSNPGVVPEGKARHSPDGSFVLLMLERRTENHFSNHIVLTALDSKGSDTSARDFVTRAVQAQINVAPQNRQLIRDTFAVDNAGTQFFRSDYKQSLSDGNVLYLAFVDTKFRGYFIGATLIAGSPEELEKSAGSLRGISFQEDRQNPKCVAGEDNATAPAGVISGIISAGPVHLQPGSRIRVSQGVMRALLITKVQPKYPDLARVARIQGTVVLKAWIDTNGDIEDLALLSGHPMLVAAATDAVKQWKYKPYILNGQPAKVETSISVDFQLAG